MNAAEPSVPAGSRLACTLGGRGGAWLLVAALMLAAALHFRVHMGVLGLAWPVTVREPAFILQTEAILDPRTPAMYSPESLPEQTNLYGPLYPLAAAPFAALLPNEPYLAHRLTVTFSLLGSCALLGWAASRRGGRLSGASVALLFYCATVSSPSLAAGPDTLATFFYIGAIVLVQELGLRRRTIVGVTALALLALMTKPYSVWVLPCFLVYVAWRHSLRRALEMAGIASLMLIVWLLGAHWLWPEYFSSVFLVHAQAATRHFFHLKQQVIQFSWHYFAPLLLIFLFAPYRAILAESVQWRWNAQTFPEDKRERHHHIWPLFMSAGAAAPLLVSMGWHAGAHMIYFNHLLLPPLLIAATNLAAPGATGSRSIVANLSLGANALLLAFITPAMPSPPTAIDLTAAGRTLVDPLLEPLRRTNAEVERVDNAQAEYWVSSSIKGDSTARRSRALAWEQDLTRKIESRYYKTLILATRSIYVRDTLQGAYHNSRALEENYSLVGSFDVNVYCVYFRYRNVFGKVPVPVYVYTRRNPPDTTTLE